HNVVHIIQLEPQFLGFSAAKQISGMAHAYNGVIAPHSAQGPLCSRICAHLNMASPNFFLHEIFDDFNDQETSNVLTNPVEIENGFVKIDDTPGWGTDLNMDVIKNSTYNENNYLPLFQEGWEKRESTTF